MKEAVTVEEAVAEAPASAAELDRLARTVAGDDGAGDPPRVHRSYSTPAGAHVYHVHLKVRGVDPGLFPLLVELFFQTARLPRQPWYRGFLGGVACVPTGEADHLLGVVKIDVGVGAPRAYASLFSRVVLTEGRVAVVQRSVVDPRIDAPPGTVLATLLAPTGDLLSMTGETLDWHHVMTVRGVRLLPGALDTAFMRLLRGAGLDRAEVNTYLEEARGMARFVADAAAVRALAATLPGAPAVAPPERSAVHWSDRGTP